MTAQNSLEHSGKISAQPFAELLVELGQAQLDGSLRLENGDAKVIIYLRDGDVVFAVSNAREHRLLNLLFDRKDIEQSQLTGLPKCSNDVELAAALVGKGLLSSDAMKDAVREQIERIIITLLSWPDGNWHYNPLVRSRDDLAYDVDVHKHLVDYARCQPMSGVLGRFKSVQERFFRAERPTAAAPPLQSHEEYVLDRFGAEPRAIEDLTLECGLPENGFLHSIYVLWLAGLLHRIGWNAAFSEDRIAAIRNARVSLVKKAQSTAAMSPVLPADTGSDVPATPAEPETQKQPELTLDEYLSMVEDGTTHYDVLGVDPRAKNPDIKASYLNLAKLFHPDRFHRESPGTLSRIQGAFSKVQAAYETLKSSDSRENYDFKVRKELEMKQKLKAQGVSVDDGKVDAKAEQGLESFEAGLSLLMDEDYERAIPFLGRAAHYNRENALYRAYFGKALSHDASQRHRAEGELQAAAKLDPRNPKIRLMLIDFFIENNLLKRAEGELKRFLEVAPDNAKAQRLLEKLQN